jgi:hypothetical protein
MKIFSRLIPLLAAVFLLAGCGGSPPAQDAAAQQVTQPSSSGAQATPARSFQKVCGPAVAGLFYPRHQQDLAKTVDQLLAEVKQEPLRDLRALVCPHAGYEFSGPVAAVGYKQLVGRDIRTVIVLAPSHYAFFEGAAIADATAYETPLGRIPISPKAGELAKRKPFVVNPPCDIRRPDWWQQSPQELPPFGKDTPFTWEHSLEVQLPFLQRTLKDFSLVPVIYGQAEPEAVADQLLKVLDDKTLLVASSDLSHYQPYDTAKALDSRCVKEICELNADWVELQEQHACGRMPIGTVIRIAQKKGWQTKLLDYRNSGDTSGDKSRGVVGYAAIAFYGPDGAAPAQKRGQQTAQAELTKPQRDFLLKLARRSIAAAVNWESPPSLKDVKLAEAFMEPRACFVTLTEGGQLRGCIGSILPEEPLAEAVIHRARSAATEDARFNRVKPEDLDKIEIEISVLSFPKRLKFATPEELLEKLRPHIDGVVLNLRGRQAVYLPQVWEQIPDKAEFLSHLAEKAGLNRSAWKSPAAQVLVYQVFAFKESDK